MGFLCSLKRIIKKVVLPRISEDVVVIDSQFPKAVPFGFRNAEINELFRQAPTLVSYTMAPMHPDKGAWFRHGYGVEKSKFEANRDGYLLHFPENSERVKYFDQERSYKIKLAYSFFLGETYTLLPFYEKNKIPFVFVLYPGGCFGLNHPPSDSMLQRIFASKYFRAVIVTKKIVYDYLVSHGLCPENCIELSNGIRQWQAEDLLPKKFYKKDKNTFDICFVAAKYIERGIDKGYDVFVDVARILAKELDDVRFHVVGGFDANDIWVEDIQDKITFYGFRQPEFLKSFYSSMDISLSPNRASVFYPGSFDGFPLNAEPGYSGVAMFATDELGQNCDFINGKDIEIIDHDARTIANRICFYYENHDALYEMSEKGMDLLHKMYNTREQCAKRVALFNRLISEDSY